MKFKVLACSALLCGMGVVWAARVPAYIQGAVVDAIRPASDVARDAQRKPAEVLSFAGIKPGDQVGELMPGRGYFTKLFCKIVGNAGHVYAVNFSMQMPPNMGGDMGAGPPGMEAGMGAMPAEEPAQGTPCTNVTATTQSAGELALPSGLDVVWTSENYHDFHNAAFGKPDLLKFNRAIFAALKPGGVYMIEDHAAKAGTGASVTETLHRIDPEQVKQEVLAAGFAFEGSSDVLSNPKDPLDVRTSDVEGGSSKFLFKFRKPAK